MADNIPELARFEIADIGTYLGFQMGPSGRCGAVARTDHEVARSC